MFFFSSYYHLSRLGCNHLLSLVLNSQIFLPWRWKRYVPPKRRFTQDLHSATSQEKTACFMNLKVCRNKQWLAVSRYIFKRLLRRNEETTANLSTPSIWSKIRTWHLLTTKQEWDHSTTLLGMWTCIQVSLSICCNLCGLNVMIGRTKTSVRRPIQSHRLRYVWWRWDSSVWRSENRVRRIDLKVLCPEVDYSW
jgi:hypothetical protein